MLALVNRQAEIECFYARDKQGLSGANDNRFYDLDCGKVGSFASPESKTAMP